jgi:hypothetical protein
MCEIRDGGREASMEEYGLDGLAASGEAVMAGLGPLVVRLAGLAGAAGRAVTLDEMEGLVVERGRELLCGLLQLALDGQAAREARLPQVTGADGVARTRAERAVTGVAIGRRQLEQIAAGAAADVAAFYAAGGPAGRNSRAGSGRTARPRGCRTGNRYRRRWCCPRTARAWRCGPDRGASGPRRRRNG